MKKRHKIKKSKSKRQFSNNTGVSKMNTKPRPQRGGTRL